jgi:hypothetical protein
MTQITTRIAALLIALIAIAVPAQAQDGFEQKGGRSLGAKTGTQHISERQRMQMEYESMRRERADALRLAREETAGSGSGHIPGWRDDGTESVAKQTEAEVEADRRTVDWLSKFLIYGGVLALVGVVVLRFRRGR